jgi:hypothetical protein
MLSIQAFSLVTSCLELNLNIKHHKVHELVPQFIRCTIGRKS